MVCDKQLFNIKLCTFSMWLNGYTVNNKEYIYTTPNGVLYSSVGVLITYNVISSQQCHLSHHICKQCRYFPTVAIARYILSQCVGSSKRPACWVLKKMSPRDIKITPSGFVVWQLACTYVSFLLKPDISIVITDHK